MMTLIKKLALPSAGSATAGSPAPFNVVNGTTYFNPYGSSGGTGDMRGASTSWAQMNLGATYPRTFFGAWLMIKSQSIDQAANRQDIISTDSWLYLSSRSGKIAATVLYNWDQELPIVADNQWVFIGLAASLVTGVNYDIKVWYKTLSGPFTSFGTLANMYNAGPISWIAYGMNLGGPVPVVEFAYTSPFVYTYDNNDFSDIVYPVDIPPPPAQATYYVNPSTGNDANDGASAGSAWKTVQKINAVSAHTGIFPAASYASGSTLVIDSSAAPLDVTTGALNINTRGLTVIGAINERFTLAAAKRILGGEWTFLASGVYTSTNTVANCVLWEDSKWMNHPVGTTYASVQASMQSTPGSFWTDGTTLYLHPFGNTDPRSDGKVYQRSCFGSTGPAVLLSASDMDFCGAGISMTCDVQNDGTSQGGYGIQSSTNFGGLSRIRKCLVTYGGKHGIGLTQDASNSNVTIEDCQIEQCSPYSDQSCWVSYMGDPTGVQSGNVHRYVRCTTNKVAGLVGSTAGTDANISCFYCHNNGVGNQFSKFEFIDCVFPHGAIQASLATLFTITGGTAGTIACYSPTIQIDRVKINGKGVMGISSSANSANIQVTNCLVVPDVPFSGGGNNEGWSIAGNMTIKGCTIDLRQTPVGEDWPYAFIMMPDQYTTPRPLGLTFINNIVISNGRYGVLRFGGDADSMTFHHNAYFGMAHIAIFYNPGAGNQATYDTLPQWQAATGKDANTISPADLMLDSGYKPLIGSPVIDKGSDLGSMADYSGTVFAHRNDIGAYEYFVPAPAGGGVGFGDRSYSLLYQIAANTAGNPPGFGDGMYQLAYKIAQNTAGTPPKFGDGIYELFYKVAQNTAGSAPSPGDRYHNLLYKIAGNTGSNKPTYGDGVYDLLRKIAINTTKP